MCVLLFALPQPALISVANKAKEKEKDYANNSDLFQLVQHLAIFSADFAGLYRFFCQKSSDLRILAQIGRRSGQIVT